MTLVIPPLFRWPFSSRGVGLVPQSASDRRTPARGRAGVRCTLYAAEARAGSASGVAWAAGLPSGAASAVGTASTS